MNSMRGEYQLKAQSVSTLGIDIFADRSALVLEWLLLTRRATPQFKVREVAASTGVSVGLAQKVLHALSQKGWVEVSGLRTAKTFKVVNAGAILKAWTNHYQLSQKKRLYTYSSALGSKEEMIEKLESSPLKNQVALALHSAAQNHGRAHTNLKGLELYILKTDLRLKLEKLLKLQPQERGYDVLLIEPYYKSVFQNAKRDDALSWKENRKSRLKSSPPLLTYLDLNQYPLRGREQAEQILKTELKDLTHG